MGVRCLMLKLKIVLFTLIFSINLFAVDVLVNSIDLNFKEEITKSKVYKTTVKEVTRYCTPVTISEFKNNKYRAARYLKKGSIICTKDVEADDGKSVLFNFGSIQIEQPGKIIFENDEYIKIRKNDGKVEKIYKDGRIE